MPNWWAISISEGRRSPGLMRPVSTASRIWSATCCVTDEFELDLILNLNVGTICLPQGLNVVGSRLTLYHIFAVRAGFVSVTVSRRCREPVKRNDCGLNTYLLS